MHKSSNSFGRNGIYPMLEVLGFDYLPLHHYNNINNNNNNDDDDDN